MLLLYEPDLEISYAAHYQSAKRGKRAGLQRSYAAQHALSTTPAVSRLLYGEVDELSRRGVDREVPTKPSTPASAGSTCPSAFKNAILRVQADHAALLASGKAPSKASSPLTSLDRSSDNPGPPSSHKAGSEGSREWAAIIARSQGGAAAASRTDDPNRNDLNSNHPNASSGTILAPLSVAPPPPAASSQETAFIQDKHRQQALHQQHRGRERKQGPPWQRGSAQHGPSGPPSPPRPPLFSAFTAAASDASATGAPPPAAAAISKRAPYKAPGDRNDLRILRHLVEAQKLEDSLAAPDMPLTGIRCGPAPGDTWARHTLAGLGAAVSLRWDDAMEDVANIPAYATGAAHVAGVAHGISAGHASRAAHPFGVASAFSVAHEGHLEDAMDGSHHGIDNHASDSNHESDRDTCRRDGHGAAVQDVAGAVLYKKLFLHRRPCMRRPADGCALQTRHKTFLAWPEPGGPGCSPSVPAALLDDEARHRKAVGSRVVDVSRREFMERRPKEVDVARARWQRDSCAAALAYSQRIAAAEAAHHQVEVRYPHGLPRAVQKSLGEQLGEAGVHL